MLKKIHGLLNKLNLPNWLTILLFVVLILRIPSFFEPFYYGDEMIYLTLGQGIRQGIPLYSGLHDNKPPLLYLTAALAGNIFWFKVILAFWSLATIVIFWHLVKTLFLPPGRTSPKTKIPQIATIIFSLLTTIPLLEGNTANAENFMIGPVIAAFLILFSRKLNYRKIFLAGALFSIAALFKIPAAFDMAVIVAFWLITANFNKEGIKKIIKKTFILAFGFILPIAATFVWFYLKGTLHEYLVAAFLQNFGYLSSWKGQVVIHQPILLKNASLLIRVFIVIFCTGTLFFFRKKLSRQFIFSTIWLVFTLFAVTLSERPYPHYLIQSLGPISILLAILSSGKNLEQSLVIFPLTLAFLVPVVYKFWLYPTTSYYLRFIKFSTRQISKEEYLSSFSHQTARNYRIADFIVSSTRPADRVFVWSKDSPTIYALSRHFPPIKYVADYHINDFSNKKAVVTTLEKTVPKFIILTSDTEPFPQIYPLLRRHYVLVNRIADAEIWSLKTVLW